MPDSIWRFLLYDQRTRLAVAELPVVDGSVTYTDVLNAPGAAKFSLPLNPPDPIGLTASMLAPPNAGFAVEAGGLIRWAGPILTHNYNLESGTADYGCEGLWSYVRRRVIRTTHFFNAGSAVSANGWVPAADNGIGWRDANIGKHILDTVQSYGTFGIDTGGPYSAGSLTELYLYAYERRNAGEAIEQNAATLGGYDFRLEPNWTAGPSSTITWRWIPTYPATGRRLDLTFDQSSSIINTVTVDSTNIAYTVHVTGQGTGEAMPVATAVNQTLINDNLHLEVSETASNVTVNDTLERKAQRRLGRGAGPIVTPTVDLPVSDYLGAFIVGDQVRVRMASGLVAVDEFYRVTSYEVDPSTSRIRTTLVPATLFT